MLAVWVEHTTTLSHFLASSSPDPTADKFFVFISILFCFSVLMNQIMAVFAAVATSQATVQVASACLLLFLILFGGFIVPPNVIPGYYVWIYWWNPFAWAYRALLVNEFYSSSHVDGDAVLAQVGFLFGKDSDQAYGDEWVVYFFLYMIPCFFLCTLLTAVSLAFAKNAQNSNARKVNTRIHGTVEVAHDDGDIDDDGRVDIPFTPITITFEDVCYCVKASTGGETLQLLNDVSGLFRSGRMCALMGASGAGCVPTK